MSPRVLLLAAAVLLAVGAAPLPYAYYRILRWVACAAFIWTAYEARSRPAWPWVLGAFAVLFNPLAPIHMNKDAWVVADLAAAAVLAARALRMR